MNQLTALFFVGIFGLTAIGQNEVKIRISQAKINNHFELLIPNSDGSYYYEKYFYFRQSEFVKISLDTLFQESDSIFKGGKTTVNIKEFTSKDPCDPAINRIRNSSLSDLNYRMLGDSAKLHIGYYNSEFDQKSRKSAPTYEEEKQICHDDFKKLSENWFKNQIDLIHSIKEKKIKRYEWINKSSAISNDSIFAFFRDFDPCESDFKSLITLIPKNTDGFLTICKYMDKSKFFSFKLDLSPFPASINTDLAISSLKNSKIRTLRKKKIIKKLTTQ
jgi:hypothetical protein